MIVTLTIFLLGNASAFTRRASPALANTIFTRASALGGVCSGHRGTRRGVVTTRATMAITLSEMRDIRSGVLRCLSGTRNTVLGLCRVGHTNRLITARVPRGYDLLLGSINDGLGKATVTTVISSRLTSTTARVTTLCPFVGRLIASKDCSANNSSKNGRGRGMGLLDSSRQCCVTGRMLAELRTIGASLFVLT